MKKTITTTRVECYGKYLSDNITEFPFAPDRVVRARTEPTLFDDGAEINDSKHITFIDKGITGCGGTTMVAQTAKARGYNVVCLMPSVSAVQSKDAQFHTDGKGGLKIDRSVQCVYGGRKLEQFTHRDAMRSFVTHPRCDAPAEFTNANSRSNVIFGTYDQIDNILKHLGDDSEGYKLVVDEYHTLTRDTYRDGTMRKVLGSFDRFSSVTMLTATPDVYLEEAVMKIYGSWGFEKIEYRWINFTRCVTVYESENVKDTLVNLINRFKTGDSLRLYLMLNNVEMAEQLRAKCKLKRDQYHLLCSKSRENVTDRSDIDDLNSEPRPINFITAAGFEGCDIRCATGQIITVVDVDNNTTMFDWQTLVQMQGRCRDTQFEPAVVYHSSNRFRYGQKEEILHRMEELRMKERRLKQLTFEKLETDKDIVVINNVPVINPFSVAQVQRRLEVMENMMTLKDFMKYLEDADYVVKHKKVTVEKSGRAQVQSLRKQMEAYCSGERCNLHDLTLIEALVESKGEEEALRMVCEKKYSKNQLKRILLAMESYDETDKARTVLGLTDCHWYSNDNLSARISFLNETLGTDYSATRPGRTLQELGYRVVVERRRSEDSRERGMYVIDCKAVQKTELKLYIGSEFNFLDQCANMNISAAIVPGSKVVRPMMRSAQFSELKSLAAHVNEKSEQRLISDCYSTEDKCYPRLETSFNATDCIILDVDHTGTIDEVNQYIEECYGNALHYIYETWSSTPENQSFRVILPLSHTLSFYDADYVKAFKKVKCQLFPDWQDPNCQLWFFGPSKEIVKYGDDKVVMNADEIAVMIDAQYVHVKALSKVSGFLTPKKEQKAVEESKAKWYSPEVAAKRINEAEEHHRNEKIYPVAYFAPEQNLSHILSLITDPTKQKMFKESVKYKRGIIL